MKKKDEKASKDIVLDQVCDVLEKQILNYYQVYKCEYDPHCLGLDHGFGMIVEIFAIKKPDLNDDNESLLSFIIII